MGYPVRGTAARRVTMSLTKLSEDRSLKVAPEEPQLQRFSFYNERGDRLGKVMDLIADDTTMKVRYLIVSMHEGLLHNRNVIIPIRDVAIDRDAERVICTDCREETLKAYPEYKGGVLPDLIQKFTATFIPGTGAAKERDVEPGTVRNALTEDRDIVGAREPLLDRDTALNRDTLINDRTTLAGERRTDEDARLELIEEELKVGKREVPTGETVVRKTVVENQVCEPVELRHERVEIERRAVNRPSDVSPGEGPMEARLSTTGEEAVMEKTAFVREEIILHRVTDVDRQNVCGEVRKETAETAGMPLETNKTDILAGKTDLAGDKIDMTPGWETDERLDPGHMTDEPRDRPIF